VYAFRDALHAIADGWARLGKVTDEYPEYLLVRPVFSRESTKSAPGDAAGGAVICTR
jgi:hypothetical protein